MHYERGLTMSFVFVCFGLHSIPIYSRILKRSEHSL